MKIRNETTILFVDDDLNFLHSIKRTLRGASYNTVFANSAEKAFEFLGTMSVAVLVTDQRMPGIKGLELLSILREKYPSVIRIMLTGHPSLPTTIDAINRGEVFRFLSKPCDPEKLKNSLEAGIMLYKHSAGIAAESSNLDRTAEVFTLEQQYPGISKVQFDSQGRISIDDSEGFE